MYVYHIIYSSIQPSWSLLINLIILGTILLIVKQTIQFHSITYPFSTQPRAGWPGGFLLIWPRHWIIEPLITHAAPSVDFWFVSRDLNPAKGLPQSSPHKENIKKKNSDSEVWTNHLGKRKSRLVCLVGESESLPSHLHTVVISHQSFTTQYHVSSSPTIHCTNPPSPHLSPLPPLSFMASISKLSAAATFWAPDFQGPTRSSSLLPNSVFLLQSPRTITNRLLLSSSSPLSLPAAALKGSLLYVYPLFSCFYLTFLIAFQPSSSSSFIIFDC